MAIRERSLLRLALAVAVASQFLLFSLLYADNGLEARLQALQNNPCVVKIFHAHQRELPNI